MTENDSFVNDEIQLVLFNIGKESFGVKISQVREIIKLEEITNLPNSSQNVKGVINLRGQITPVIDLKIMLGFGASDTNEHTRIIVVELGKNTIGMIVDSVSEVIRIRKKDIDSTPSLITTADADYITGIGKLDNRLLTILDLSKILPQDDQDELANLVTA